MHDTHRHALERQVLHVWQTETAQRLVVVAADRVHGCNRRERIKDGGAADIAGVQDRVDAGKRVKEAWVDVAVRVRDNAELHGVQLGCVLAKAQSSSLTASR